MNELNELTKIDAYKKDTIRIGALKYQIKPYTLTRPDILNTLINEHYELEKLKSEIEQLKKQLTKKQ